MVPNNSFYPYDSLSLYSSALQPRQGFDERLLVRDRDSYGADSDAWYDSYDDDVELAEARYKALRDTSVRRSGDFGWSLGYAAASCYRDLTVNRISIVAAIDDIRQDGINMQSSFRIFNKLDECLFGGKLKGMVCLSWKAMEFASPGSTSAPGIHSGRISIRLNSTPFRKARAGIDDMLDMLIHQMIHAYFLVCCGTQSSDEKQDGRLLDDIHWSLLVRAINDITNECAEGPLYLTAHSIDRLRRFRPGNPHINHSYFIAVDPHGSSLGAGQATGQTCCLRDNRHITRASVMNWQVEAYARHINEDWASRGEFVYFSAEGKVQKLHRTMAPPSKQYAELVWNDKRVAVGKKKALALPALKKLAGNSKHGDVKLSECSKEIFACVWSFIQFGSYMSQGSDMQLLRLGKGAKAWSGIGTDKLHIQVCRYASSMKLTELMHYALDCLQETKATDEDPIELLSEVYDTSSSSCIELQRWCRKFLSATNEQVTRRGMRVLSNYERILEWDESRFLELYHKHASLRDDCKLIVASLATGFDLNSDDRPPVVVRPVFDNRGIRYGNDIERYRQPRQVHPL